MAARIWAIRSTEGGSTGLEFARAQTDAAVDRVLAHALPSGINVEVFDESGDLIAKGSGLEGTEETPMALLTIERDTVRREQLWPSAAELELPVILPGGETGLLTAWWHSDDHSEWRWSLEFSNRR